MVSPAKFHVSMRAAHFDRSRPGRSHLRSPQSWAFNQNDPAMAVADPPPVLLDIASTLAQDEIPFKLRCAICSKLAVNAFRLPCCDQSICENCQTSLTTTCPVCAHSPVSPDLCKPNKALRTTLKAFLRTEEKKREKDRQAATLPSPTISTTLEINTTPVDTVPHQKGAVTPHIEKIEPPGTPPAVDGNSDQPAVADAPRANNEGKSTADVLAPVRAEAVTMSESAGDQATEVDTIETVTHPTSGDMPDTSQLTLSVPHETPQQVSSTATRMVSGGFPGMGMGMGMGMGWNGTGNYNAMNPFMPNSVFNLPNSMGMPMTMDSMAADQGMFGDYGLNITGMGMNMGMNYNGQSMYGSLGWNGFQQDMWQGGQDNFNPSAFANGAGSLHRGTFGGSNSSYSFNSGSQSGYYSPGYGRGAFRGRGRGYFQGGPGRGSFGGPSHSHVANSGIPIQPGLSTSTVDAPSETVGSKDAPLVSDANAPNESSVLTPAEAASYTDQQLQEISTVDSLDQPNATGFNGYQTQLGPGYGRISYMYGGHSGGYWGGPMPQPPIEPKGPGVEGAPAAPRAMRQGLPNTSVLRQRGFHMQAHSWGGSDTPGTLQSGNVEAAQESAHSRSRSPTEPPTQDNRLERRTRSPSHSQTPRPRAPSTPPGGDDRNDHQNREMEHVNPLSDKPHDSQGSRSPSQMSSHRSSRHHHRYNDRDRKDGTPSHRSRRHRSRRDSYSRSPSRSGYHRRSQQSALVTEDGNPSSHNQAISKAMDRRDSAGRANTSHRSSKDRPSRGGNDHERDTDGARNSRHRERDRDRAQGHHRRDRDRERERERERDREYDRDRARERDRKRKQSRRDRSESASTDHHSSRPRARRIKRDGRHDLDGDRGRDRHCPTVLSESDKDPHTLEREARNRERLLREQQRRKQVKSGHRRDTRQERVVAGRRINYKYEDEL